MSAQYHQPGCPSAECMGGYAPPPDRTPDEVTRLHADLQAARATIASLEGRLKGREDALEYAQKELEALRTRGDVDRRNSKLVVQWMRETERETVERCIRKVEEESGCEHFSRKTYWVKGDDPHPRDDESEAVCRLRSLLPQSPPKETDHE